MWDAPAHGSRGVVLARRLRGEGVWVVCPASGDESRFAAPLFAGACAGPKNFEIFLLSRIWNLMVFFALGPGPPSICKSPITIGVSKKNLQAPQNRDFGGTLPDDGQAPEVY